MFHKQRYLYSSDDSTNFDHEVQNALLMLNVSRTLPSAGASTQNASSVVPIPSSEYLSSQHSDPRMHHTSMQPALMTSAVNNLTFSKDTSAAAAPSSMSLAVDSDEFWESCSVGPNSTSDSINEPLDEMELRVKALLLQQADLEKVGYGQSLCS